MFKPVAFDTLSYARMLRKGGVQHADVHSASLADALNQNTYTKNEADTMFAAALKRSDDLLREFAEQTAEMKREFIIKRAEFAQKAIEDRASLRQEMQEISTSLNHKIMETNQKITETNNRTISRLTVNIGIIFSLFSLFTMCLHYFH